MELYDVVPTEKQGLDQGSLSNRKEFTNQNSCAKEQTQLFKVLMQEKHPQANDWRNFLEFTALIATTKQPPPLCYTPRIYISHIVNRMTLTART